MSLKLVFKPRNNVSWLLALGCLCLLLACAAPDSTSDNPGGDPVGENPVTDPALMSIEQMSYAGAFRLPAGTFGNSSLNYSQGPLAYDAANRSMFIVGHTHHQNIAEFELPQLVNSRKLSDLNIAAEPVQAFQDVLNRGGEAPENLNRIGGLALVDGAQGSELWVNAYEYYDAPADNTLSTQILKGAEDLSSADATAFFGFEGNAGHTSGWLSPVPKEWQAELGGSYLTGQASGIPINSRSSIGPSAFVFDPASRGAGADAVATTTLLDFDLQHRLAEDLFNKDGSNKLWTHLSHVTYGFIVPGTRSYLTLGHSGGHESGVCYKCTQSDGNLCGGYCAPDANDYYLHYWLWDLNDLLAVKNGELASHAVRPYDYGELDSPFAGVTRLGGGSFDADSGLLYLSLQAADREQGRYSNPPVIAAYQLGIGAKP